MDARTYLLSIPERVVRSALGLSAGVLREVGEVVLPKAVRRSQLYQSLVDTTLRFVIEQVGGTKGIYPAEQAQPDDFIVRRGAEHDARTAFARDWHARSLMLHLPRATNERSTVLQIMADLRRRGWTPTAVHTGEAAVEAAAAHRYTAVLMDVRMPGISGVEAFREIHAAQPRTPVILMTAYAAPELLDEAVRDGVVRILPKPIPWGTLSALLVHGLSLSGSLGMPGAPALCIEIVGEQFWWRVHYLDAAGRREVVSANEVRVPVGATIELLLSSRDVIHSFWVPSLAGKLDMIPGRVTSLRFAAERPGIYRGHIEPRRLRPSVPLP